MDDEIKIGRWKIELWINIWKWIDKDEEVFSVTYEIEKFKKKNDIKKKKKGKTTGKQKCSKCKRQQLFVLGGDGSIHFSNRKAKDIKFLKRCVLIQYRAKKKKMFVLYEKKISCNFIGTVLLEISIDSDFACCVKNIV